MAFRILSKSSTIDIGSLRSSLGGQKKEPAAGSAHPSAGPAPGRPGVFQSSGRCSGRTENSTLRRSGFDSPAGAPRSEHPRPARPPAGLGAGAVVLGGLGPAINVGIVGAGERLPPAGAPGHHLQFLAAAAAGG